MRKSLIAQFVLVSLALVCTLMLNTMLLSIAVEQQDINYSHVVFSTVFFFCGLMCQRLLYQLKDERDAELSWKDSS